MKNLIDLEEFENAYKKRFADLCRYESIFSSPRDCINFIPQAIHSLDGLQIIKDHDVVDSETLNSYLEIKAKMLNHALGALLLYVLSVNSEFDIDFNVYLKACGEEKNTDILKFLHETEGEIIDDIEKQVKEKATEEQKQSIDKALHESNMQRMYSSMARL